MRVRLPVSVTILSFLCLLRNSPFAPSVSPTLIVAALECMLGLGIHILFRGMGLGLLNRLRLFRDVRLGLLKRLRLFRDARTASAAATNGFAGKP